MPADITGTEVIEEQPGGGLQRRFMEGPLFANVILADEINRTPPKTQAALLEAMQERQLTVGRQRHSLSDPFFVLATQNPIEQEGTYPLPEAQQDRFMFKVLVDYPSFDDELEVARRTTSRIKNEVESVLSGAEIQQCRPRAQRAGGRPCDSLRARFGSADTRGTEGVPDFVTEQVSWELGRGRCSSWCLGRRPGLC